MPRRTTPGRTATTWMVALMSGSTTFSLGRRERTSMWVSFPDAVSRDPGRAAPRRAVPPTLRENRDDSTEWHPAGPKELPGGQGILPGRVGEGRGPRAARGWGVVNSRTNRIFHVGGISSKTG